MCYKYLMKIKFLYDIISKNFWIVAMKPWENMYKIIKELGGGTSSNAFFVQDASGNNHIIKTCAMGNCDQWENECKAEIEITSKLAENVYRKYDIPKSSLYGEGTDKYMVSSLIKGEELSKSKLSQLSIDDQVEIATSLAQFMYQLHLHNLKQNDNHEFTSNSAQFFHSNDYEIEKQRIYKHLPLSTQESMNEVFDNFDKDPNVGKITSTCHNDLIKDNLLYDTDNKKLGIIDFGDLSENDVYSDFANLMKMGQLGDQFAVKVINQYNKFHQNNNSNIHINAHSVKKYAIMKSFKSLKRLDKVNKTNKKLQTLKFNSYLKEYNENKSSGLFKATNSNINFNENTP